MTDQLKKIFIKKYPTIDRIQYSDIYSYPHPDGCERAYFTYTHKDFLNSKKELASSQIRKVASDIFDDIGWEFHEQLGSANNIITFNITEQEDEEKWKYQQNYSGHDIMIQKKPLGFTIETGHRGNSYLLKNQREKYIGFIDGIIRQMLKNAKN
ncbi:TPA: hypothetical protein HA363_05045 [Candidatus Woesearchaeota archaeon]|nr:hypothetical protein [Candidatus Woesearchaeota archaeon]